MLVSCRKFGEDAGVVCFGAHQLVSGQAHLGREWAIRILPTHSHPDAAHEGILLGIAEGLTRQQVVDAANHHATILGAGPSAAGFIAISGGHLESQFEPLF
ncbi:hypothetical protein C0214_02925 [Methylobacterium sp. DM1]|nr:hypothetical protein C0214_02925 [Methylobacterium sp. DM1]